MGHLHRFAWVVSFVTLASGLAALACGEANSSASNVGHGSSGSSGKTGSGGASIGGGGTGGGINVGATGGDGGTAPVCDPGAFDYPGNGQDEDCSGVADDEPANCDVGIPDVGYGDPMVAAKALGLCRAAQGTSWGVISAKYVLADGSPGMNDLSHGLLPDFGPNLATREGQAMLALSSGAARRPGDPGFASPEMAQMGTSSAMPAGFPVPSPSCPGVIQAPIANDAAALEVVLQVPTNAKGFTFDFDFYTYEFPEYICSTFNDFFVAIVSPAPAGAQQGNVSFDSQGNPVSVNNGFLEVCASQTAGGKQFPCALGTAQLQGTGYDEMQQSGPHAATGWLVTQSPVTPGSQITIRFAIWDAGDHILDSLALIDNFHWIETELTGPSTEPVH
jgi:hypothetical protein